MQNTILFALIWSRFMKERALFICNTPFQTLVASWIKYHLLSDIEADISISDHMKDGKKLCQQAEKAGLFEHVFYSETLDLDNWKINQSLIQERIHTIFPNRFLKRFIDLNNTEYSRIYFSNINLFPALIYSALCHRQTEKPKLYVFEDGLSTYSNFTVKQYKKYKTENFIGLKQFLHEFLYKDVSLYGNIESVMVFNPELVKWDILPVQRLDKIEIEDLVFRKYINSIFQYEKSVDVYDKRCIFIEESFYADGNAVNDVELIEELSKRIGKENIMVKIHPRNPENRFKKLGYKTNEDISIPWEVILMNLGDISEKTFVTILSGSITNPILIFGKEIHAYSLYNLIKKEMIGHVGMYDDILSLMLEVYHSYPRMIKFCDSISEIKV